MLGVQDEVHVHKGDGLVVRHFVEQHVKEVAGVVQVGIGRDRLQAVADPVVGRNDGRGLGSQPQGLTDVGFPGVILRFFVKSGQPDHRGLEDIHWVRRLNGVDYGDDFVRYPTVGPQEIVQLRQLRAVGQLPV